MAKRGKRKRKKTHSVPPPSVLQTILILITIQKPTTHLTTTLPLIEPRSETSLWIKPPPSWNDDIRGVRKQGKPPSDEMGMVLGKTGVAEPAYDVIFRSAKTNVELRSYSTRFAIRTKCEADNKAFMR